MYKGHPIVSLPDDVAALVVALYPDVRRGSEDFRHDVAFRWFFNFLFGCLERGIRSSGGEGGGSSSVRLANCIISEKRHILSCSIYGPLAWGKTLPGYIDI